MITMLKQMHSRIFLNQVTLSWNFAGHYDPSFTIKLCVKDLRLIDELAQKSNVPLMMGNQARNIFHTAQAKYGQDRG